MNPCGKFVERISAKLDGPLTAEEKRELEAHLAVCPACRALEAQLAAIHAAFPQMEEVSAPEGFAQGVMERIRAQEGEKAKVVPLFKRPQIRALASLAACAALCVGLYRGGLLPGYGSAAKSVGQEAALQEDEAARSAQGAESSDADLTMPAQYSLESAAEPEQDNQLEVNAALPSTSQAEESAKNSTPQAQTVAPRQTEPPQKTEDLTAAQSGGQPTEEEAPQADNATIPVSPQDEGETGGQPNVLSRYQVAGQQVAAILTLTQLPDGAEEILGPDAEWRTDEAGRSVCIVTGDQMEALMALAEEQGQDLTGAATNRIDREELCAVVLEAEQTQTVPES